MTHRSNRVTFDIPRPPAAQDSFSRRWHFLNLICIISFAIVLRLAMLQSASLSSHDSWLRPWIAQLWAQDPEWIDAGVWPPLHFYLLGIPIYMELSILSSVYLIQISFSTLTSVVIYLIVLEYLGPYKLWEALWTSLIAAAYPLSVLSSLEARAETPALFFVLMAIWAIVRWRRSPNSWLFVVIAAISATLASMLRYEAWILLPIFALAFWPMIPMMLAFAIMTIAFPVTWMWGNYQAFGDPLYSFHKAAQWVLDIEGRKDVPLSSTALSSILYIARAVKGITLPITILLVLGTFQLLKTKGGLWLFLLVPAGMVLASHLYGILKGSLHPKLHYSTIWVGLLLPILAVLLENIRKARSLKFMNCFAITLMMLTLLIAWPSSAPSSFPIRMLSAKMVPNLEGKQFIECAAKRIRKVVPREAAIIVEDFGMWKTDYLLLLLDYKPNKIWRIWEREIAPRDFMVMAHFDISRRAENFEAFIGSSPVGVYYNEGSANRQNKSVRKART